MINNITSEDILNIKTVVLATNNKGKVSQIKKLLAPLNWEIKTLEDIGYHDDIVEDGTTFEENAFIKTHTIATKFNIPTIAEDSGISIDALNGEPGIYTARFGGNVSKKDKLVKILNLLKDVPAENRGATFVSVMALELPNGKTFHARGECPGEITTEIINLDGGMALTPIFKANENGKVLSTVTEDELILVNHRGKACREFIDKLTSL